MAKLKDVPNGNKVILPYCSGKLETIKVASNHFGGGEADLMVKVSLGAGQYDASASGYTIRTPLGRLFPFRGVGWDVTTGSANATGPISLPSSYVTPAGLYPLSWVDTQLELFKQTLRPAIQNSLVDVKFEVVSDVPSISATGAKFVKDVAVGSIFMPSLAELGWSYGYFLNYNPAVGTSGAPGDIMMSSVAEGTKIPNIETSIDLWPSSSATYGPMIATRTPVVPISFSQSTGAIDPNFFIASFASGYKQNYASLTRYTFHSNNNLGIGAIWVIMCLNGDVEVTGSAASGEWQFSRSTAVETYRKIDGTWYRTI